MNIYTVFDKVADECGQLFEQVNDGTAMRAYRRLFKDGESSEREFKLLYLGKFDRQTGKIEVEDVPKEIYVPDVKEGA